jgi:hypothetical protein
VIVGNDPVIVEIKNSESGYENKIYWSDDRFKTRHYLGIDNKTGTYALGSFTAGTRIDFGIDNGMNQFFTTGGASSNADNFEHARATATADGVQVGLEDLFGGGDKDFNDAIVTVRSESSATTRTPDNRSGLGDGTNPGQGAGRTNSPNTGTANPNNAGAHGSTPPPFGGLVNVFA